MNELHGAEEVDWEKAGPILDEAIGELSEIDRDVVCLRFFENLKYPQIGDRLGMSENSARMRVERALDKLHGLLSRRGVKSTSATLALALGGHASAAVPVELAGAVVKAATAGVLVGTGGATIIGIMTTTKASIGIATVAAFVSVGTFLYSSGKVDTLAEARSEAMDALAVSEVRIAELEAESELAQSRIEEAEGSLRMVSRKLFLAQRALSEEDVIIDRALIQERFKRAQELNDAGRLDEALTEFMWLFDTGMPAVKSYAGVRASSVLSSIAKIGETLPEALVFLRERRDRAEDRLRAGEQEGNEVGDFQSINRVFGEQDRSLALFDEVQDEGVRVSLRIYLQDELIEKQRYADAYRPGFAGSALHKFDHMINWEARPGLSKAKAIAFKERNRRLALKSIAQDIEVLAGAQQIEDAVELVTKVLETDRSPETIERLRTHLKRANADSILDTLLAE